MPEIDVGDIKLQAKDITGSEKPKDAVAFDDRSKKDELQKKFAESAAGKEIQTKLNTLRNDADLTIEGKKKKLEELIKDFFSVEEGGDEHIQRLLADDGKQYMIIHSGKDQFAIALEGTEAQGLMKELISWYLDRMATTINGTESDETKKIALKYDAEKITLEQTQKELATLKQEVTPSSPQGQVAPETNGDGSRSSVVATMNNVWQGKAGFQDLKNSVRGRVSHKFAFATGIVGSIGGVFSMFGKKDLASQAAENSKRNDFSQKILGFKDKIGSALGFGSSIPEQSQSAVQPEVQASTPVVSTPETPDADATPPLKVHKNESSVKSGKMMSYHGL